MFDLSAGSAAGAVQHAQCSVRSAACSAVQHVQCSARSAARAVQRSGSAQPAGRTGPGPMGQHARPNFSTSSHLDSSNQTDI